MATLNKEKVFADFHYRPHSREQWMFHNSNARVRILCAGSRFGKSECSSAETAYELMKPKAKWWIVAPTYNLGEIEFLKIHEFLCINAGYKPKYYNASKITGHMFMEMPWGSTLEVKSAERPDNCLGAEIDGALLSEGSQLTKDFYDRYLRARLINRKGKVIIPTTPQGEDDFLFPLWQLGQDPVNKAMYESWQFPTWLNPYIDRAEIDEQKKHMSAEHFNEQFGGQFVKYSGLVYKEFDINLHRIPWFEPPKNWRRECGIDYGTVHPFVCLWAAIDNDGKVFIYDEHSESNRRVDYHAEVIKRKNKNCEIEYYWIDPSASGAKLELSYNNISTTDANNDLLLGVERVRWYLAHNMLFIMDNCPKTCDGLRRYHYPRKQGAGNNEKPEKHGDDECDAARYIISGRPSGTELLIPQPASHPDSFESTLEEIDRLETRHDFLGNSQIGGF